MEGVRFIPERSSDKQYRTVIILLDGTGNRDDGDANHTNVCLLNNILYGGKVYNKSDGRQLVHYATGIGADQTESYLGLLEYAYEKAISIKDQAIASSFQKHLVEAYRFLVANYREGDRICIFGFSRGAYTARALAGMLNAMGLLKPTDIAACKAAYNEYAKFNRLPTDDVQWKIEVGKLSQEWKLFKDQHDVRTPFIEFLGCWDSVNSIGMINNIRLSFTATNDIVKTFRHALSLDERRAKFRQNMWGKPKKETSTDYPPRVKTDVEEVWFAGCHADVGGGSVKNGTRPNLAHISLRWMIRECFKRNTGIIFAEEELAKLGISTSSIYPVVQPRPPVSPLLPEGHKIYYVEPPSWKEWAASFLPDKTPDWIKSLSITHTHNTEEEHDLHDAFAPHFDQLVLKSSLWTSMETLFLRKPQYDHKTGKFKYVWTRHNGIGRTIPPPEDNHGGKIKVHRTVQMRMQATYANGPRNVKGQRYVPPARMGWQTDYKDKMPFQALALTDDVEWVA